jgi:uncharacterized protein
MSSFADTLREFLQHPDRPEETMSYGQLHGFLFAVAGAPEVILPSDWMREVFGGNEPGFKDEEEARIIQTALIEEYNAVNGAALKGEMPPGCVLRDDPVANLEGDAPVHQWALGFLRGYSWLSGTWDDYLGGDELADDSRAGDERGPERVGDGALVLCVS